MKLFFSQWSGNLRQLLKMAIIGMKPHSSGLRVRKLNTVTFCTKTTKSIFHYSSLQLE